MNQIEQEEDDEKDEENIDDAVRAQIRKIWGPILSIACNN